MSKEHEPLLMTKVDNEDAQTDQFRWTYKHTAYLTLGKVITDTQLKIIYPFLPVFAHSLNTSLTMFSSTLAIQNGTIVLGPLFVAFLEMKKTPTRWILYSCWISIVVMNIWSTTQQNFVVFVLVRFVSALVYVFYFCATSAIVASAVPPDRIGTVLGITQMGWAFADFLCFPAGTLIEKTTWFAPFLCLSGFAVLMMAGIPFLTPSDVSTERRNQQLVATETSIPSFQIILFIVGCMSFAGWNFIFITVQGIWMADRFEFRASALGLMTFVSGIGLILGNFVAINVSSRPWWSAIAMSSSVTCVFVGFTLHNHFAPAAMSVVVAFVYFGIFFIITKAVFSLLIVIVVQESPVHHKKNATSAYLSAYSLGGVSAFVTPHIYMRWGIVGTGVCIIALALTTTMCFCAVFVLRKRDSVNRDDCCQQVHN